MPSKGRRRTFVKLTKHLRRTLTGLIAGLFLAVAAVSPASAATTSPDPGAVALFLTTSCTVHSGPIFTSTSCKTGTIHAANDRKLNYHMCAAPNHYADWQIKDANNGHIVAQGRVQAKVCVTDTVSGLFGDYWSWVFNTRDNASAEIDNS
jgi:hypothetical protein